jgi:hypothetical protein
MALCSRYTPPSFVHCVGSAFLCRCPFIDKSDISLQDKRRNGLPRSLTAISFKGRNSELRHA